MSGGVRSGRWSNAHARMVCVLVAAVLAGACSTTDVSDSAPPARADTKLAAAAVADFTAFGSIRAANVIDAPPKSKLVLRDAAGKRVAEGTTDEVGSFIFRALEPADGYMVEHGAGAELERTKPFAVLDEDDAPPASLYDQEMTAGLNYVRMRDGIELAATVRLPPNATLEDGPFPTVIEYSGYEVAPPNDLVASIAAKLTNPDAPPDPLVPSSATAVGSVLAPLLGFATVSVQIRGSGCSGGEFDMFNLPSIYDGYDIIETVATQPWVKGGKVGMVGISYSGYSQLFVGGTRPPHLAALAPMSVLGDLYRGIGFPGGIFNTGFAKGWLSERQRDAEPAPEGGQKWAGTLIEQGDERCRDNQKLRRQTLNVLDILDHNEFRNPLLYAKRTPADWAEDIEVPVFLVGGLQDEQLGSDWANMIGSLDDVDDVWVTLYNGNHNDALGPEILTRWVEFLNLFVADRIPEIPNAVLGLAGVLYQQIGSASAPSLAQSRFAGTTDVEAARATFRDDPRIRLLMDVGAGPLGPRSLQSTSELAFSAWPPPDAVATRWHLAGGGRLVPDGQGVGAGRDTYVSDASARPKFNAESGSVVYSADEAYDWAPVADGKGLAYSTEPLAEDLVVAGPASLDLRIAADAADADVQVTVTEVRPDGQETYLSSGWLRLSHRTLDQNRSTELHPVQTHLEEDARDITPGQPVDVRVPVNPFAAQFRAGSRIRITLTAPGGDTPAWDFRTTEDGSTKVSVVREDAKPSSLVLPVLPGIKAATARPPCNVLRGQPCRAFVAAANGG